MTEPQPPDRAWKIDHSIPAALIVTLLLQGGVLVWWGAGVDTRLTAATADNARQDAQIKAAEVALSSQEVNAATTAAQLTAVRESLTDVKNALAEQNTLLRELLTNGKDKP
jgi:hypothetical protein